MIRTQITFLVLLATFVISGQESVENIASWKYDGFSYADFGTGEAHSYFSMTYKINPQLYAELRGFYDTYRTSNVFDLSYRMKWYAGKKMYLFSGIGVQKEQRIGGQGISIMPTRMLNGFGYEPNKNMRIEAVHDLNFNTKSGGLNATPSLFTLSGKYRF